ncbi:MAG: C10 family peptidase [Bacteroidales bacterium]|nr:C10 family peptidase [Bacteroidales bacterium]MDG2081526.1 C10 family peptidase [Bacteroidales bacterium]
MKSKTLLTFALFFAVSASIIAKDISLSKAEQIAINFFFEKSNQYDNAVDYYDLNIKESYLAENAYYVINLENGWVIVAANDAMTPIIGYNFSDNFPKINHDFGAFDSWMQDYVDQIDFVRENNIEADNELLSQWSYYSTSNPQTLNTRGGRDIDPLLTALWNQDNPYNRMCPEDEAGPGGRVYVGCVSTAMSLIMHYWRYPLSGSGEHSYYKYPYGTLYANFGEAEYNWDGMTDVISDKYVWKIAEIGFHGAVSVDMNFGPDGSGAYSQDVPYALATYFNFQNNVQYISKNGYTNSQWESILQQHLDDSKPLYYSGQSTDGGHAFVCDGYQGSNYYHFNFGWGGSANGYYSLQDVNGFNSYQGVVRNIYPEDPNYPYISEGDNELTTPVGSFTDGSGPAEDYPTGMEVSWLINPQNAQDSVTSLTLSFREFDTYSSDKVRVYDGGDENAELIGEYSGSTVPTDITSTGNQLYVTFSSVGEAPGFKIEYSSTLPSYCTSTSITEPQGTLSDGSGGFWYNNFTSCVFNLAHPEAVKYHLDFTQFSTEEDHDMVKVYNGENASLIGEFSGSDIPDPIEVETSTILLMWTTNSTVREDGWSLNYSVDGVGVEETTLENLNIYPNPTNGILNINFNAEKQGDMNVKLISISGQVIFNEVLTDSNGSYNSTFDISSQPKGVYLLSIISDSQKIDRKIVLK